jgi:hypothetical protein
MRKLALLLLLLTAGAAHATQISDKYAQLGGAGSFLGNATTTESPTPDGVGRFQHFQGGSIYYHPQTGTHEVHGLIRQRWASLGWELSYLGYPMTDEISLADGSGKVTKFQGGEIIWRTGASTVSEVKSTDLIVDIPFKVGEVWEIGKANADETGGSHNNAFAYCWDMNRLTGSSGGRPFAAVATAKIAYVEQGLPSGDGNAGNVVIQRLGEGRYASYLHIAKGSYTKHFANGPGILFLPQDQPWSQRPSPATGTVLGEVGDTGTGVGNHHMHFCVTTTPDRAAFGPFESVPVAFRNYSVSTDGGATWTYVPVGVPRQKQLVRREAAKAGQAAGPQVNATAVVISHGTVTATVTAINGKPTAPGGKLTVTLLSAWGEPLKVQTMTIPSNNVTGPWVFQFTNVPAFNKLKLTAGYTGPWSLAFDFIGAEGSAFNLAPNGTATQTLTLKTTHIH